jgi:hypothetical protein
VAVRRMHVFPGIWCQENISKLGAQGRVGWLFSEDANVFIGEPLSQVHFYFYFCN